LKLNEAENPLNPLNVFQFSWFCLNAAEYLSTELKIIEKFQHLAINCAWHYSTSSKSVKSPLLSIPPLKNKSQSQFLSSPKILNSIYSDCTSSHNKFRESQNDSMSCNVEIYICTKTKQQKL